MPNLKQKYRTEIAPVLMREFDFANVMEAPRVQKVVINIGMGEAMDNAKMVDAAWWTRRLVIFLSSAAKSRW